MVCIHGQLARSCEICEAMNDHATACEQNNRLRAKLAEAHVEIAEQARLLSMSAEREARLLAKLAECERVRDAAYEAAGEVIDERDLREEQIEQIYAALGGEGEWRGVLPPQEPPNSGDLGADALALAHDLKARVERLEAAITDAPHNSWCALNEGSRATAAQVSQANEVQKQALKSAALGGATPELERLLGVSRG